MVKGMEHANAIILQVKTIKFNLREEIEHKSVNLEIIVIN